MGCTATFWAQWVKATSRYVHDNGAVFPISMGSPLFEARQVDYLEDGAPFEYSTTRHAPDYEFYVVSAH